MWVPAEVKDPILLHAPTRKSVGYFGAVRLRDGKLLTKREEKAFDAETFWRFLKLLRQVSSRSGRKVAVISDNAKYWSFHKLGDISLFKRKVMFYILWYAPGWEDITAQYIGRDALSCYRSAPSRKRCRGDREAARCTLGQCITLAYKMAPGWREGS
jgi:hypothetical protein